MAINIGAVSIYQDIELSLTEHLVPPVVHVKQFDHMARKVRCALYNNAVEYTIPANVILAYSGTRPDGRLFQYSTESLHNDKVDVVGNRIIVTISDFMTEVSGRYPVDLVMIDADGDILGSFSFTLYVEKAANKNRKILTATYGVADRAGVVVNGHPQQRSGAVATDPRHKHKQLGTDPRLVPAALH